MALDGAYLPVMYGLQGTRLQLAMGVLLALVITVHCVLLVRNIHVVDV
jgi:hypothetical protein